MITLLAAFLTSFLISVFATPSVIKVATIKNLVDEPCSRKKHLKRVPTLGGVAIFGAIFISIAYWLEAQQLPEMQYIFCSLVLIFFVGIKDDVVNLVHYKKLVGQFMAAFILVESGGIRLESMYGIFGVYDISYGASLALSIFVIIGITNAFNLIDGVDLLALTIGIISAISFGIFFVAIDKVQWAVMSAALAGSLIGFSVYNKSPARIFMGDTGALVVGMMVSILAIKFVEFNRSSNIISGPTLAISILIIPIFDTFRVFLVRILRGKRPFDADRSHLHHLLIDNGFTHIKTTFVLAIANIATIGFAYLNRDIGKIFGVVEYSAEILLLVIFIVLSSLTYYLSLRSKKLRSDKNNFQILA